MSRCLSKTLTSILIAISLIAIAPSAAMSHLNTMHMIQPDRVRETYVYSFKGTPDGSFPTNITPYKGAFYGTTQNGGANSAGSFFVFWKATSGFNERVLYSFPSGTSLNGAPLAVDNNGVFYGETFYGGGTDCGGSGCGAVFALVPTTSGYVQKTLYRFDQNRDGGGSNVSQLVLDCRGALYGGTGYYGPGGGGTVFKLTPNKSGYSEQVLYAFGTRKGDGIAPEGPLLIDRSGDVYGVTFYGGLNPSAAEVSAGNAFELTKTASGYVEHILYQFGSHPGDGVNPTLLIFNPATGTLFGIANYGGDTNCGNSFGCGTVFELLPKEGYRERTVHVFDGVHGGLTSSLVTDGKGGLYGTTEFSGSPLQAFGVLFELTPSTSGFTYSVLYQFDGPTNDGYAPSYLLRESQSLFGVTEFGGAYGFLGGTFFEIAL